MSKQIVGDVELSAEDLAALRENLIEQRLFRVEQLRRFSDPAATRADRERGRRAPSQVEVDVRLSASARMVLADVEAALQRMDDGRYGRCHLCRRPIAVDRLRIVPQARFCGPCHRIRETSR